MRIAVDLDGCCYDFAGALRTWLINERGYTLEQLPDPQVWDFFTEQWGMTAEEFERHCADAVDARWLFRIGTPEPGAVDVLRRLKTDGHTLHIVTNRSFGLHSKSNTETWLKIWGIPHDSLTFSADKTVVDVDVMIEDNLDNYEALRQVGIECYLYRRPWNDRPDIGSDHYVRSWDHFHHVITHKHRANADANAYGWPDWPDEALHVIPAGVATEDAIAAAMRSYGETLNRHIDPTEVRITSDTGGQKGSKLARFDMIPSDVLWELAEHYGLGERKYPSDADGKANWQRGYDWSLSVAALQRHLHEWLMGKTVDDETGDSPLIAVAWHAFALRWWEIHGIGRDDLVGRKVG